MAVKLKKGCGAHSQSLARRVKSGCNTCKRRKVKCDEKWPVCDRCQSTGRACDGYGIWGGGSHDPQASRKRDPRMRDGEPKAPSPRPAGVETRPSKHMRLVALDSREAECFEWFMCRSAVKLPGAWQSDHWTTILFQTSTTEPAIRHAMLALGSAHQEEVRGIDSWARARNDKTSLFTMTQYSKSINCLQPCLTGRRKDLVRVALIACSLFVYMEFLRGQYSNGMLHLEYGLSLLREALDFGRFQDQDMWSLCVDGWVITFLTRNLVQAKLWGQMSSLRSGEHLNLDPGLQLDTFKNIHHARRSLEHIMLQAMDVEDQSPVSAAAIEPINIQLLVDQTKLIEALNLWLQVYETTMGKLSPGNCTVLERFAFRLLRLYYHLAVVLVGTCLDPSDEMRYDQYESTFSDALSHCTETWNIILPTIQQHRKAAFHRDPEPSSPQSTSDIGWISPLYLTATKCRNHRLRHRAIGFMHYHVHKEGIWNSTLAVLAAKKVVEIEEGSFYHQTTNECQINRMPEDALLHEDVATMSTLPAELRLGKVEVSLPDDRTGKLVLQCQRNRSDGTVEWIRSECDLSTYRWQDDTWRTSITHA